MGRIGVTSEQASRLAAELGPILKHDEPLCSYTTFGTGGPARLFIEADSAELLARTVRAARRLDIPTFLLGGGSNLLVSDRGYNGLVIRNVIAGKRREGNILEVGAGEMLQTAVDFAAEQGLSGLEFAAGIWGTVGGAVFGNAGAYGAEVGAALESAELIDREGNIRAEKKDYFQFGYRTSILKKTGEFVVSVRFLLMPGEKAAIRDKVKEIIMLRESKLPLDKRSAGCFFKNIIDRNQPYGKLPAGQLLEEIGAKNMALGGARVSERHANILVNDGPATSEEIRRLAEILKSKVKEKFGIELQEEITLLGDFKEE